MSETRKQFFPTHTVTLTKTRSNKELLTPLAKEKRPLLSVGKAGEFESVALLLQGGGALGAYQGGVYQALAEAGIEPDWVGGISIGAVVGAIIAGNRPADRVRKLRELWEYLTANPLLNEPNSFTHLVKSGADAMRILWGQMSASVTLMGGVRGFFSPHHAPVWSYPPGSTSATSYYTTAGFRRTLQKFIDFDFLNSCGLRYTTSAVNVRTGNFTIFDIRTHIIGPEHVLASGALPPAMPAVEIEGQYYWDGGLVSNTPLQWVMDEPSKNTLVFQVDLWSSRGGFPRDIAGVMTRQKEIQYSSRTRAITDRMKHSQRLRHAFAILYEKLPEELKHTEQAQLLNRVSCCKVYNIVHLIYRAHQYEGYAKDFEFSRPSMEDHWRAGYNDTVRSLRHKEILKLPTCPEGIQTFDLTED